MSIPYCFYHKDHEAKYKCQHCGNLICTECKQIEEESISKFGNNRSRILCPFCNLESKIRSPIQIILTLTAFILFLIPFYFGALMLIFTFMNGFSILVLIFSIIWIGMLSFFTFTILKAFIKEIIGIIHAKKEYQNKKIQIRLNNEENYTNSYKILRDINEKSTNEKNLVDIRNIPNFVCYFHRDRSATYRCTECGRNLCLECEKRENNKSDGRILCPLCDFAQKIPPISTKHFVKTTLGFSPFFAGATIMIWFVIISNFFIILVFFAIAWIGLFLIMYFKSINEFISSRRIAKKALIEQETFIGNFRTRKSIKMNESYIVCEECGKKNADPLSLSCYNCGVFFHFTNNKLKERNQN